MSHALGMPVLVDNRPGAGGSVGLDILAHAAPDGHTLALSAISPLTLMPLIARTPYDPMRAVVPVAGVMRTPVLVVGTPAFTGSSFGDLITQAREQPGALRQRPVACAGRGGPTASRGIADGTDIGRAGLRERES